MTSPCQALDGEIHLSNSVTNERGDLFLATDLTQGQTSPEGTERLALKRVKLKAAVEMALRGEINDELSVIGLLLAARLDSPHCGEP